MLFIIFIIILIIYLENQKKVYNKSSSKKVYTYPKKNKNKIDNKIRDLSSKQTVKKETLEEKKSIIKEQLKDSDINKELIIEEVSDKLDENSEDIKFNKNEKKFNPKEAFIYSEIFNRKY